MPFVKIKHKQTQQNRGSSVRCYCKSMSI